MNESTPCFAVFGQPIAHSLSPRIHAHFAAECGIALRYEAWEVSAEALAARLAEFTARGGRGVNLTLPLKSLAVPLCAELSDTARRIGAVNTLRRRHDSRWRGDNTDGIGLIRDLTERQHLDLRGRRGLLLGAGGAARAVAFALLEAGVEEIAIVNRTPERAQALVDALGEPDRAHAHAWTDLTRLGRFELLIDATSAGHRGETPGLPFDLLAPRAICYHLSYGVAASAFLAWARTAGASTVLDGLGMLIEQAAESFAIWHGIRPPTAAIYAKLRAESPLPATG
jgi:shikimate dehydrogenase